MKFIQVEGTGLVPVGEPKPRPRPAKLTLEDRMAIALLYRPGDPQVGAAALARKYGVSRATIWAVVNGRQRRDHAPANP
jgi:hypothetical protein